MNEDLLILIKKLNEVKSMDDVEDVRELGKSFLRKEKRQSLLTAMTTLMAIYEEFGDEEIIDSIAKLPELIKSFSGSRKAHDKSSQ